MNVELLKDFQMDEIEIALKCIAPLKASREDGFPSMFYQKFWHIVGDEISRFCLDVLNRKTVLKEVNNTTIILLPKVP